MTLEKDYRRNCYVIQIPMEEMKGMFIRANDKARTLGYTEDELVTKELYEKILCLINSDMRGET